MRPSHQRAIAIRVVGLAAVAAMALGVQGTVAGETIVTRGEFAAFATSSDPAITGHATMVRTADGKTIVTVSVRGLAPSTDLRIARPRARLRRHVRGRPLQG